MATSPTTSVDEYSGGFQSVLDEAQQLMEDIDISFPGVEHAATAASFTIDDDDDEDVQRNLSDENVVSHPLAATSEINLQSTDDPLSQLAKEKMPSQFQEDTVTHPKVGSTSSRPTNGFYSPTIQQHDPATPPPHSSFTMEHLHQQALQPGFPSSVKQQAQRFGSDAQRMAASVLSMAQRAARDVVANVPPTPAPPGTFPSQHMPPPSMMTPLAPSPGNATMGGMNLQPTATSEILPPQLDQEEVLRRLRSVVTLLEGEQVIMMLHPLIHASDSTGMSYYNYQMYPTMQVPEGEQKLLQPLVSCAMTFYRVIVFEHTDGDDESAASNTHMEDEAINTSAAGTHGLPRNWNPLCWSMRSGKLLMQIPLSSLERVEKNVFSTSVSTNNAVSMATPVTPSSPFASANPHMSTSMMGLILTGKDNQRVIRITTANYQDTLRAHQALQTYAFPGRRNLGYLFAFESRRQEVLGSLQAPHMVDSTGVSSQQSPTTPVITCKPTRARFTVEEFHRQLAPGKHPWMVYSTLNHQYQLCSSYPAAVLVGPATLNAEVNLDAKRLLQSCAQFRSENRLPVLTWSSGVDGASLWRASQPKVGLQGNRNSADEMLLKHVLEAAASANAMQHPPGSIPMLPLAQIQVLTGNNITDGVIAPQHQPCLKIMDLRPRSAAMANRTAGYGYENTSNYPGATLQFCGIDNIHKVRDSYQKLNKVCMNPMVNDLTWNSLIEDTKWLAMIRLLLAAAWESAFWISVYRYPVLLHCSHGWDRTSQVAALAQLLLDPFYRTREGFSTLVEKDFMSFGHPFHTRCAHGEGRGDSGTSNVSGAPSVDEGQISPIFIQFLDCVFQLVNQYPECFEFNAKYLLIVSEHVYSCRFGTFLCDTERERELVAGIRQRTYSLWDYLESRDDLISACYNEKDSDGVMLMPLPTLLRNVTLWSDRHCMYGPKPTTRWIHSDIHSMEASSTSKTK